MDVLRRIWDLLFSLPWLDDMASYLHLLPLYPVFSTVHFVLTAHALRKEPGSVQFAMKHPVASCVMTFAVASSGGILANLMMGTPPLECVANGWSVLAAVVSWYLVFFSPLNVCFYLCSSMPLQVALFTVEEVARAKKILSGVTAASAHYPHSLIAMAVVGTLKGSGKKWGITWYRLVYQPEAASVMELKGLSFITKASAILALLYAANMQPQFCEQHQLILVAAVCLCLLRYRTLLVAETDFFDPILQVIWGLATLLSVEPPPQHVNTESSIKADTHKQQSGEDLRTSTCISKNVVARGESTDHEKCE